MLYYHSFIFNSSFFQVFYEFLRTFFYRSFSLSCFCFCDKILVMKKNRQKIIKYEKTLLLWIPFLIILAAVAVLIPQVTKILDRGRMYSITENIGALVPVVPESQIISEVKVNQELAPQEAVPETVETAEPESPYGWKKNTGGKLRYINPDGSYLQGLKYISNKLYYFDASGNCASRIGTDVSFYNGSINWRALKKVGIDFVIIRLGGRGWGTGATLYEDSRFFNNLVAAKAAGLDVGVYFFTSAVNTLEIRQEASLVIDRLRGFSLELPVFFDTELSGNYPNGRADKLSMAQRTELAKQFCTIMEKHGYQAGIYASESYLNDEVNYNALSQYCIWMASYTENNELPSQKYLYNIWQLSDRGRLPGISGYCDINVIFED